MSILPSNSGREISTPRVRALIPVSGKSVTRIEEAGGMDFVIGEILEGATIKEIAAAIGVPRSDLTSWQLNLDDPRYTEAMKGSAETCLDRAEQCLDLPGDVTMAQVQLARERCALWRHRAAVRDSRYSPKGLSLDLQASPLPAKPPSFTINIMQPDNERVIESRCSPGSCEPD